VEGQKRSQFGFVYNFCKRFYFIGLRGIFDFATARFSGSDSFSGPGFRGRLSRVLQAICGDVFHPDSG
jgi:hypothetical protein